MIKKFHSPLKGKLKVIGYVSGSGNTLWQCLKLQNELESSHEGCPFEIVGVFSSNPEAKAIESAKKYGIDYKCIDIKKYYRDRNKPFSDIELRKQYDKEALDLINDFNADAIILAGYVWHTTEVLLNNYLVVNVHPADLSIMKDNVRLYAGAHGVGDALNAKEKYIASSSHIATSDIDNGPIFMISPKIYVDYLDEETMDKKDFIRKYLKMVNKQSRIIGAMTIYEIALGNYGYDSEGNIYYKNELAPTGKHINNWEENIPNFKRDTSKIINPQSIAVIGASPKGGIGYSVIKNIIDGNFKGDLFAVNRLGKDVINVKGFKSVLEIDNNIDMAVVTIPSNFVIDVVEECGKKGVKSIVCISAGFKEIGQDGIEKEKALINIVNKYNMRLLGPNCMGVLNTSKKVNLNATILQTLPNKGGIGFITQSGALGAAMLDFSEELGLGFSIIASLGNQGDINVNDLLPYLMVDNNTEIILLYLETIQEPQRFKELAKKITRTKPIILIKSGRTNAGAKAASSHTGSLAGNDKIVDSLIEQCGIIRVSTLEEAFMLSSVLSKSTYLNGNNIAVITNAGGPGILTADKLFDNGFQLDDLPEDTKLALKDKLFKEASINNPLDIVAPAPPEHYGLCIEEVAKSGKYNAIVVICVPPATISTEEVAKAIVEKAKYIDIPIITSFFGPNLGAPARKVFFENNIPSVLYPEQTGDVLSLMHKKSITEQSSDITNLPKYIKNKIQSKLNNYNDEYIDGDLCNYILSQYGFNVIKSKIVNDKKEIEDLEIQFPVVAKIEHKGILHKSDVGGVVLNIENKEELIEVFNEFMSKFEGAEGVLVQEQVEKSTEIILGAVRDDAIGHSLMIGLGGITVELFKDVSFLYVPTNRTNIMNSIKKLKSYPLLKGFRGKDGVNLNKLIDYIEKLNNIILDFPEIIEMDINPLIYSIEKDDFIIVDYRFKIS